MASEFRAWWTTDPAPGNLGDLLTPRVLAAYGHVARRVPREQADWFFVGSTVRFARPQTNVVGAGAIDRKDRIEPRARYLAVRGPITAEMVRAAGGCSPEVLGDPAMLLPRFHCGPVVQTQEVGLIPHYVDVDDPQVASWTGRRIDVLNADPMKVVDEIRGCAAIFSSSLHGIIVSHAYGIPAAWVRFGNRLCGDDVKFADYAASAGIDLIPHASLGKAQPVLPKRLDTEELHSLFARLHNYL